MIERQKKAIEAFEKNKLNSLKAIENMENERTMIESTLDINNYYTCLHEYKDDIYSDNNTIP